MPIIRYTTPTIRFEFSDINVTDISVAYLTFRQGNQVVIERDLSTAEVVHTEDGQTVTANYISWTLEQTETKNLSKMTAIIYCDWKLSDGTRGRSHKLSTPVEDTGKQEII